MTTIKSDDEVQAAPQWPEGLTPDKPWRVVRQMELPPLSHSPNRAGSKYELHELEINDAIETTIAISKNIAMAARQFAKRNPGYKFITRKVSQDTAAIVRIA